MRSLLFLFLALALAIVLPGDLLAAEVRDAVEQQTQPGTKRVTLALFIGDFRADDNPGQLDPQSGYGWGVSGGYFFNRYLSMEGEFLWFRSDCQRVSDKVIPGTADNDQRYLTLSLSALVKAGHRFGRWRPFVGVGAGYFDTEPYVTHPDSGLFDTTGAPSSESAVGYQATLGVCATVHNNFQLEAGWKAIFLEGDFGAYTNGEVDLGGDLIYIAARFGGR